MSSFQKVAKTTDIPPGQRLVVELDEITVAIFNVDGDFFCIEDQCTHDNGPVAEGPLDGHTIMCPRHGALFDIRDGSVISMPAVVPIPSYPVKVEGDDILIEVSEGW